LFRWGVHRVDLGEVFPVGLDGCIMLAFHMVHMVERVTALEAVDGVRDILLAAWAVDHGPLKIGLLCLIL
jgi:hypothetical protein